MKHVRIKRQTRIFWSWNFLRGNLSSTTGQKMKIIKLLTSQYIIQNKNFRSWNYGGKKILKDLRQSPWIITSNHSLVKAKIGELQNVQNFKGVKATKANYNNRAQSNKREIIKKKKKSRNKNCSAEGTVTLLDTEKHNDATAIQLKAKVWKLNEVNNFCINNSPTNLDK